MARLKMRTRLKIKEIAESRGFTRASLARRADLTYETVFKLWRNPYQEVTLLTLVKIAHVLGVQVSDLYEVQED
jgi:DNA-binding Xre family transcriptional regulator